MAGEPALPVDDGVDGAGLGCPVVNLVQKGHNRQLVGHGYVDAQNAGLAQAVDELAHVVGRHLVGHVPGVNATGIQRRLLKYGRHGVANGVADDAESGVHPWGALIPGPFPWG